MYVILFECVNSPCTSVAPHWVVSTSRGEPCALSSPSVALGRLAPPITLKTVPLLTEVATTSLFLCADMPLQGALPIASTLVNDALFSCIRFESFVDLLSDVVVCVRKFRDWCSLCIGGGRGGSGALLLSSRHLCPPPRIPQRIPHGTPRGYPRGSPKDMSQGITEVTPRGGTQGISQGHPCVPGVTPVENLHSLFSCVKTLA